MAKVTELVTEFKFKGDTKPLKDAGDQMQRVSENSGIASKRMDSADGSLISLNKSAFVAGATFAVLAKGLKESFDTVLRLGEEVSMLKGLGIDPKEFRNFQDLFVELGSSAEEGGKFVEKFQENLNLLELGKKQPFFLALKENLGVTIDRLDTAQTALDKIRKASQRGGFSKGNIGSILNELGFDSTVTKVLTASQQDFAKALNASANYAKLTQKQLDAMEETNEEFRKLTQASTRLWEQFSADLAPALTKVILHLGEMLEGVRYILELLGDKQAEETKADAKRLKNASQMFADPGSSENSFPLPEGVSITEEQRFALPTTIPSSMLLNPSPLYNRSSANNSNSTTTINVNVTDEGHGAKLKQKMQQVLREEHNRAKRSR
jgi:hypothetical protein